MTRLKASALVLLLWAGIYLPGLGSTEIKGEEGRRILPAITMLETGNWLVPYVGGKPFLRKPPLVNWAIAAAFKLTGKRNEWTARMPSALCVLGLGLTIVATSGARWMNVETAFVAAVMAMTQFGLLAKARFAGAEIEGIYAPLSAIAIVCWLAWWSRACSPWLVWVVPGFFLGLASLAKGPSFHLVYFCAIALTVLGFARRWRDLLHPAPFAGIALAALMFAAWAVPYFRTPEAKDAAAVWKRQGIDRFTESEFNAGNYFTNIPRGLMDQLPWLLLAPAAIGVLRARRGRGADSQSASPDEPIANPLEGCALASAGCFFAVLLIPGTLPRYVLPLGAPFALALAAGLDRLDERSRAIVRWHWANRILAAVLLLCVCAAPFVVSASRHAPGGPPSDRWLAVKAAFFCAPLLAFCAAVIARRAVLLSSAVVAKASGGLLAAASIFYAVAAVPWITRGDDVRPLARAIDAGVPPGERLVLYDPGYLAAIFYLRRPYRYAIALDEIPADARWVLIRGKERRKFAEKRPEFVVAREIEGKRGEDFLLLQRDGEPQKLPAR